MGGRSLSPGCAEPSSVAGVPELHSGGGPPAVLEQHPARQQVALERAHRFRRHPCAEEVGLQPRLEECAERPGVGARHEHGHLLGLEPSGDCDGRRGESSTEAWVHDAGRSDASFLVDDRVADGSRAGMRGEEPRTWQAHHVADVRVSAGRAEPAIEVCGNGECPLGDFAGLADLPERYPEPRARRRSQCALEQVEHPPWPHAELAVEHLGTCIERRKHTTHCGRRGPWLRECAGQDASADAMALEARQRPEHGEEVRVAANDRGGEGDDATAHHRDLEAPRVRALEVCQRRHSLTRSCRRRRAAMTPGQVPRGANEDARTTQHVGAASLAVRDRPGCGLHAFVATHAMAFSASRSNAVTHSSRCSSRVSSILLWLMPCRLWTNIITVGTPARATSAASWSGPEGSRWSLPQVSWIDSSQSRSRYGSKCTGSIFQIRSHATTTLASAAKRSLAARASANRFASPAASRCRWSSVIRHSSTTLVTMPGLVVHEPMVDTPPCLPVMRYTSSPIRPAARNASRRRFMGVLPECAAWPRNVIACRSTPKVPSTVPIGR